MTFEASSDNGYGYEKYIYNGFNQMTTAVAEDGTVTKYTYGCDGLRTSKKVGNNQTVYFELDRGNVFKEAYADGTAVQKYLWGAGLVGNGKGEFYLKNGHGDVVQIVNSSFEVKIIMLMSMTHSETILIRETVILIRLGIAVVTARLQVNLSVAPSALLTSIII